jgi:hypothetical protein
MSAYVCSMYVYMRRYTSTLELPIHAQCATREAALCAAQPWLGAGRERAEPPRQGRPETETLPPSEPGWKQAPPGSTYRLL